MEGPTSFPPVNSSFPNNSNFPGNSSYPSNSNFRDSSTCDDDYLYPDWINKMMPVYIYSISALGIPLNLLVLLVFLLHKKACTATEIYLSNMATADLLLLVFLPFWGVYVANQHNWTFGEPMCKIVPLLIVLNYNCSIYFLILICLDRFLALAHPLSQWKLRRRKYAKMSCVAVWCFGLLLNIPTLMCRQTVEVEPLHYNNSAEYICTWTCSTNAYLANETVQMVVTFAVPLLIISFCTFKILQALKERPSVDESIQKTERKVTLLVLAVLLAFLICWLPHRVLKIIDLAMRYNLIKESCTMVRVTEICQQVFVYFAFFNSDLNPILYVFVGKNFRMKMWEVLRVRSSLRKLSTQFVTPTTSSSLLSSQKIHVNANTVV